MSKQMRKLGELTRIFLCLAAAAEFASVRADDLARGSLIQLSSLSPFRDCTLVSADVPGSGFFFPEDSAVEPHLAVDPMNARHQVAAWMTGGAKGRVVAVSFDAGRRWQQTAMPGLSLCSGGKLDRVVDPWLTFAPSGDLYCINAPFSDTVGDGITVSKSKDGGLHWSEPTILWDDSEGISPIDKPSITADPANANLIYAVWDAFDPDYSNDHTSFTRSADGGRTWEPVRTIYVPGGNDSATGHQILVLRNGALVCLFQENHFNEVSGDYDRAISSLRSTDKGRTWSARIRAAEQFWLRPSDPDTGHPVISGLPAFAVDRNSGALYAVWEDSRFSNGQYNSIAFAQSTNGGLTWSAPIPVNRSPKGVAPLNRQAFLPSVAVASDGSLAITYYDFRYNDPNPGCLTDYWLVHCRGSATNPARGADEVRLTNASFDLEKSVDFIGSYFLGDYFGLSAAGNEFVSVFGQIVRGEPNHIFFRRIGFEKQGSDEHE